MYSGEGEQVKLFLPVLPSGNVEDWLQDVEKSMKATLRDNINRSLKVYHEVQLLLYMFGFTFILLDLYIRLVLLLFRNPVWSGCYLGLDKW